ncbi:hypothetical protein Tco_0480733 [Tanacetum coccineum]
MDFFRRVTALFQSMMVQAPEDMGEDSAAPTDSHLTPIITQPSSSKPQKKKSRRKQRKDSGPIEPITDGATNEEHIPTSSYDPPQSGEDSLQRNELMETCTNLQQEEDASKQGRKIADLDADVEVTLIDETQRRNDKDLMFDTSVLDGDKLFKEPIVNAATTISLIPVSVVDPVTTAGEVVTTASVEILNELTLAQTLIEIKSTKPKAVTTAATIDKGKGIMVEEPIKMKKKDQIMADEEVARNLEAQLQAKIEEEEKLAGQREEDANIAEWDDVQAMMDADYELAKRLQAEKQGELTIKERSKLVVELMNKRKKHFAKLKAEEQRRKPPNKEQKRSQVSTYLKNMAGYKHNQLKNKSFEEIQMLFDNLMKWVDSFVPMDSEVVKGSKTKGSSKRAEKELESDNSKKQKIDEHVEAKKDDDQEEAEMKKHMEIVQDEEEISIDTIPLATKPPMIVEYKIMLQNIDREDLETLWKLVKANHGNTRPEEGYERVLWGDLKVMFEPDVESEVWRELQGYKERECFDNSSMALIPAAGVTLGIVLKQESGWYLLRKAFLGGPSLSYTSGDSKSVPNRSGSFDGWKPLSPLQLGCGGSDVRIA